MKTVIILLILLFVWIEISKKVGPESRKNEDDFLAGNNKKDSGK